MEKLAVYEDDITLSKIPSFKQYALTREYFQYHSGKKSMKQIQKCPHCHKDSVFSHNICPNCGFESKYEERGEPDYKLDENGKVPSYAFVMEEHMTQCQRHGHILLGVIMGLLGAPLLTWAATNVFLLTDENRTMEIPLFRVFLACVIVGWIFWTIWNNGYRWLTRGVMAVSFLGGFWMLGWAVKMIVQIAKKSGDVNPVLLLGCLVFGTVYVWCAWQLWRSRDIPEFLRMQYQKMKDEEI
jgi:ribosomal protein L32